jgi:hypothetical protein
VVHDFPLEELGPRTFEQLAVALSLKVLGPGVNAFGSGPDGGREATYTGPVNWSATFGMGAGTWDGYIVIQAKQREFPSADAHGNAAWLKHQIAAELDAWTDPGSRRGRFPQYVIFVTNVRLTSVPESGGIDSVNEYMRKRVHGGTAGIARRGQLGKRGLRDWKTWHRDQLNALLTMEDGIRRAFPAMLTAGDVLTRLGTPSGILDPQELHLVLTAHARNTLETERWVNLAEAGDASRHSGGPSGSTWPSSRTTSARPRASHCCAGSSEVRHSRADLSSRPARTRRSASRLSRPAGRRSGGKCKKTERIIHGPEFRRQNDAGQEAIWGTSTRSRARARPCCQAAAAGGAARRSGHWGPPWRTGASPAASRRWSAFRLGPVRPPSPWTPPSS